jgi:RimJ/RimL family protein N-acetyltransferase
MRHDLVLEGFTYRLRPISNVDAPFVLKLRGNPILNRYLHDTSPRLEDQLAWFAQYYERPGDYYFVVERLETGVPEGVIAVYDIDPEEREGEWGRWILQPDSLAAVESAWLIYRCAFELLELEEVISRTVVDNVSVVSFHDSCGINSCRVLHEHFELGDRRVDAIEHRVNSVNWSKIAPHLEKLSQLVAKKLNRD